jgi:hypothetical protein
MSNQYANITNGPPGWIQASFTFNTNVILALKSAVGRGNYRYSPNTKIWCYRKSCLNIVQKTLELYDYEIEIEADLYPPTKTPLSTDREAWEAVFRSLPASLAPKIVPFCSARPSPRSRRRYRGHAKPESSLGKLYQKEGLT